MKRSRPGAASAALLLILVITGAWWALALWPAGAVEPEWLVRTRAACFGSARGGLPDLGGWILLIGEPIGMLGVLFIVWGDALRAEVRLMRASRLWRATMVGVGVVGVAGVVVLGRRVLYAAGVGSSPFVAVSGTVSPVDVDVSAIVLTDQHGRRASIAPLRGRPSLLTFAFGHCVTVCPTIVHDVMAARSDANRPDVPLLIISLDPWRDTPERLPSLAAGWKLGPDDRVLSGRVEEVEQALNAIGIVRRRDETTGDIDHTGTLMMLDHRGYIRWRLDGGWGRVRELLGAMPSGKGA